jgi:hypothetical protein
MQNNAIRNNTKTERKIISVSIKRQLTIPQKYFEELGFDNEAECILQEGGLLIRPVRVTGGEFGEQILSDLIAQGYEGQDLLEKFREYSKAVRPAVLKMIEDADEYAKSGKGRIPLDELFEMGE